MAGTIVAMPTLVDALQDLEIPGTTDQNWEPSVVQLLEWYEKVIPIAAELAAGTAKPAGRPPKDTSKKHVIDDLPHYFPPWTPQPAALRAFWEAVYRPGGANDTENRSLAHRAAHALGATHNAQGWSFF
jgi:hypothetical protein